ncbi:MAG: DUF1116 domain-containing protein, partial [Oscillospiraceae bacterium]|nr:DUF1116 domain-containing protein [Oscillospiraceae bacterium]
MENHSMFNAGISAVNLGIQSFGDAVAQQGASCVQIHWKPPVDRELAPLLDDPDINAKIDEANRNAMELLIGSELHWVGMRRAIEVVPGMKKNYILHSGPPITWERMGSLQRIGCVGGALHEGLAKTREEALAMLEAGEIEVKSSYDFDSIGAGAGIVTASMIVNICENSKSGFRGYCAPFEGRDGLSLWGVYNEKVEANLQVIENVFAPAVNRVLETQGPVNVSGIIARALQMNDELHSRQTAASLMLLSELAPKLLASDIDSESVKTVIDMLVASERWFHPLTMSSAMANLKGIQGLDHCTLVTMCCLNGVKNGVKFADTGAQWFFAEAPRFHGQYFSSEWTDEDACLHMGDSTVVEVVGLGGFAAAAGPVVLRL